MQVEDEVEAWRKSGSRGDTFRNVIGGLGINSPRAFHSISTLSFPSSSSSSLLHPFYLHSHSLAQSPFLLSLIIWILALIDPGFVFGSCISFSDTQLPTTGAD